MIDALRSELGKVGIRGRRRRRILAEIADHLACDPEAKLGDPTLLARQFADELGASRSRTAALAAFAALSLAGSLYATVFVSHAVTGPGLAAMRPRTVALGDLAIVLVVLAPQLSFVAGSLALLRAVRRRRETALPAAEVRAIVRRTGVALAAGLATLGGLALFAYEYGPALPGWLRLLAYLAAGVAGAALVAVSPALVAATRVQVSIPGVAGDAFDDLGHLVPGRLRGRPWRLAFTVATIVFLAVTAAGIAQDDPFDGALRGLAEGIACLAGFALLGRFLGLRER